MSRIFAPHVTRLALHQFRNYQSASLTTAAAAIVLTGHNGAGKTNILEALSLLSPGRGLRHAPLESLTRQDSQSLCAILADLTQPDTPVQLATGLKLSPQGKPQRVVLVDDVPQPSQGRLVDYVNVQWLVPKLDRLFVEASAERRRFFDRLVYAFVPSHLQHLQRYEYYRREWLSLVQLGTRDAAWLDSIEEPMASHAVQIAAARLSITERLNEAAPPSPHFPQVSLRWEGMVEQHPDAGYYRDYLKKQRTHHRHDAPPVLDGVHRGDLIAHHRQKGTPAALCSTGEQKALLVALTLAGITQLREATGRLPVFLFDEVAAHFDATRRAALFEAIASLGCQAWYTGTEAALFDALRGYADFINVEEGTLHPLREGIAA